MSAMAVSSPEASADGRRQSADVLAARLAAIAAACDIGQGDAAARVVERRLDDLDRLLAGLESDLRAAGVRVSRESDGRLERLSEQELRVARLVARGLSNSAIASELWLSPRTVSSHLYRIFPKLAISSRVELAALMVRGSSPTARNSAPLKNSAPQTKRRDR
jgi:DNA-binding NarL/FixJ family response regulator